MKISKSQTGFSVSVGLLVVTLLGVLGFVAWKVYQTNNAVRPATNNAQGINNSNPTSKSSSMSYRTIDQGEGSSINLEFPSQNRVIKSSDEWGKFWKDLYVGNKPEPPVSLAPIDFDTKMVIAIVMGSKGEVALNIKKANIEKIENLGNQLVVRTTVETWGDNCVTPSVTTSPYHIVEIDKTNSPIEFTTQKTVKNC